MSQLSESNSKHKTRSKELNIFLRVYFPQIIRYNPFHQYLDIMSQNYYYYYSLKNQ
jgi:hypothetical protein